MLIGTIVFLAAWTSLSIFVFISDWDNNGKDSSSGRNPLLDVILYVPVMALAWVIGMTNHFLDFVRERMER